MRFEPILREGHSCWRRAAASRVGLLVDGEAYFRTLAEAIERAEHQILLIGWDFHSRVRLRREGADARGEGDRSQELLALLERQVRRRRRLRVCILAWDYAVIYALEREWQPLMRFQERTHRRISFRLDDRHPIGASHHQKIAVIDDALAFCGGLDVTTCRWDTREHRRADPRRSDPGAPDYAPFHDVQLAVDGAAARALGELARQRWRVATDRTLQPVTGRGDPWPPSLPVHFRDVDVGIARTRPAHRGLDEVREVEALWLDAVRAARRSIYLENQYFTSQAIGNALIERLREPDGPEVVAVVSANLSGWLERNTMGMLSARLAQRCREADRFGRLRLVHPVLPGGDDALTVHAKVLIVDDRLLRVGSSNASNRSLGLDSECDLALESTPDRDIREEIAARRDDLLAEHLGATPEAVAQAIREQGSLRGAVDTLGRGERHLAPLEPQLSDWMDELLSEATLLDPERPLELEELLALFEPESDEVEERGARVWALARVAVGLAAVVGLAVAWTSTPLREWIRPELLAAWAAALRDSAAGLAVAVALFALASALLAPVTALTAASGLVFGFAKGVLVALAGSVLGAALGYGAGRSLWRDAVRRLAGPRLDRISRRLGQRGVLSAAAIRIVPVAPFAVVNLVAGASHIRARDFLLGTLLGMAPGTGVLVFFGDRIFAALRRPGLETWLGLALAALAVLGAALLARGWWLRRGERAAGAES